VHFVVLADLLMNEIRRHVDRQFVTDISVEIIASNLSVFEVEYVAGRISCIA
jgi:hypothetical protein